MSIEHAPQRTTSAVRKLISKAELLALIPLSYVTIWELMRRDKFPRSIKLGETPHAPGAAPSFGPMAAWLPKWFVDRRRPQDGEK